MQNAVPLPPDEACKADPARARPDLEGGEGEVVNVARAFQEEVAGVGRGVCAGVGAGVGAGEDREIGGGHGVLLVTGEEGG